MSAVAELPWTPNSPEANLRLLFAGAPLCFAKLDLRGNIQAVNPALRHFLDESQHTEPSRLTNLISPELALECDRLLQEMSDGLRTSFRLESGMRAHQLIPVRWTVWRVSGMNGADYALALAEKLGDSPQSDERLHQEVRLESVGRLAVGVVHDFNNLLTGVLLYCDLLLANLQRHEARKYAEEIRSACIQAAAVVRQLLNIARPANFQPRLLSLNEVVEAVRELLTRLMGEKIQLRLRLDSRLGLARLDCTQAQQILLNLVLNARDAMPHGGEIVIETRNCEVEILHEDSPGSRLPCVLLVVNDNGVGMDAATRARMFEAFFTTKGNKGTGLGLAGVYDIVSANGGLIHVESALGTGTRVKVLLPRAEPGRSSAGMQEEASEPYQELLPLMEEE